jgi:uncharacterized protein (TIRG00374 family)
MKRTTLGRILGWAAPLLLAAGVASQATNLSGIADALVGVKPGWLAAAGGFAVLFIVNQGALYRAIFRLFDVKISLRASVRLALAMAFGSLAIPAGTVTGIVYFVAAAGERGVPGPTAVLTSLAFYLFDYGALLPFVAAGGAVLLKQQGAEALPAIAGGMVLLVTAIAAGTLLWGLADGRAMRTVSRLASAVNRIIARLHRRPVDPRRAAEWVDELREIAVHLRARRGWLPALFLYGLATQLLNLGILTASFRAVGTPVSAGILVAGYAVGTIFSMVSIVTPSGLGFVEATMTLALVSLDVPVEPAIAATVLYRLFTFWMQLLVGYISVRHARAAPTAHPSTASS